MSEVNAWTIHIDGAARGNPGPAAFAYVISGHGAAAIEEANCLGRTTNNVAEYTALVRALERARQLGAERLAIFSDSELLVKQMNGEYQVKNKDLKVLFDQAKKLCGEFQAVRITHVRREQNRDADRLCNEALDGRPVAAPPPAAPAVPEKKRPARSRGEIPAAVQEQAIACLREAAQEWAKGNAEQPPPEEVWQRLWAILQQK